MTRNEYRELSASWYLGAHREAMTTEDIAEARELYESRIQAMQQYIELLEAQEGGANGI